MLDSSTAGIDKVAAPSIAPVEQAIDLTHLARMTLGDASLERELLQLFNRQGEMLLARMDGGDAPLIAASAHTIKGSARGIGAWRIARDAETVEVAAGCADAAEVKVALTRLKASIAEAKAAIVDLLRAH